MPEPLPRVDYSKDGSPKLDDHTRNLGKAMTKKQIAEYMNGARGGIVETIHQVSTKRES